MKLRYSYLQDKHISLFPVLQASSSQEGCIKYQACQKQEQREEAYLWWSHCRDAILAGDTSIIDHDALGEVDGSHLVHVILGEEEVVGA